MRRRGCWISSVISTVSPPTSSIAPAGFATRTSVRVTTVVLKPSCAICSRKPSAPQPRQAQPLEEVRWLETSGTGLISASRVGVVRACRVHRSGVLTPERVVGAEIGSCPPPLCATTRARPHTPGDVVPRAFLLLQPADGRHLPRLEEDRAASPPRRPPRDDVGLPQALRRGYSRSERDRLSCTARTAGSTRPHSGAASAWPSRSCSSFSARCPAPTGSPMSSRGRNGVILTGTNAGGESLLEAGIRDVLAAGDVRWGLQTREYSCWAAWRSPFVGARMTPATHASIAERDDIEAVSIDRREATGASPGS
jgi:hypothetical protein